MQPKNVQKLRPEPKRSLDTSGGNHELGLWMDFDVLRRQLRKTVIHDNHPSTNNRYLELADLALGTKRSKKKSKGTAASE